MPTTHKKKKLAHFDIPPNSVFRHNLISIYRGCYRRFRQPIPTPPVPPATISPSSSSSSSSSSKVIVLDLDGTIGSFQAWVSVCDFLLIHQPHWIRQKRGKEEEEEEEEEKGPFFPTDESIAFFCLDKLPELFRPGIWSLLSYLKDQKRTRACSQVIMYTNNYHSPHVPDCIVRYIHQTLHHYPLFDDIIYAFKIRHQIIDPRRSSHEKTHQELIQCTLLPPHTEFCFIDDREHVRMKHANVYYIQPKTYHHDLATDVIALRISFHLERFLGTDQFQRYRFHFALLSFLRDCLEEQEQDQEAADAAAAATATATAAGKTTRSHTKHHEKIAHHIMQHLQEFFISHVSPSLLSRVTATTKRTKKRPKK